MHFTVMVIADDVDEALAPFYEQPDEHDEACAPYLIWTAYGKSGSDYQGDTKDEVLELIAENDDELSEGPYCSNSQGMWDWYQVGGRWSGVLKYKPDSDSHEFGERSWSDKSTIPEGYCDSVLKKDFDMKGLIQSITDKANAEYDEAIAIFGDLPPMQTIEELNNAFPKYSSDHIRKLYETQPRYIAAKTASIENPDCIFGESALYYIDKFCQTREEYTKHKILNSSYTTYAFLKDGEWISSDTISSDEWFDFITDQLNSLDDNDRITIVDYHV